MNLLKLLGGLLLLALPALGAEPLNVVATLPDLAAVAELVGGTAVKITMLARPTEDPHFVDPKPSFARVLNKADVLIEGGADLEAGWLPPLLEAARNPRILPGQPAHLVASTGLALKEIPTQPDRSEGDVHPGGNPHYLMDPLNAARVARTVADGLSAAAPAQAAQFKENATRFEHEIAQRLPAWEARLQAARGMKVISYHRTFTYFMDRFGLQLVNTIEPKPGLEPSPSHIIALIKEARENGVKLILIEANRPRKTADKIAAETGAKVVVLEHMPGAQGGRDYYSWIDGMTKAVAEAADSL